MASKVINELTLKINADVGELKQSLQKGKDQVSAFQSSIQEMGNSIRNAFSVVAIIGAAKELFNFGKEAVLMSKGLVNITGPFEALNKPDLLKNLQDATGGTVKNLDLMRLAVKAEHLQVPLDKMGVMLAFVKQRAKETGGNFQEMADKLVTGIGKNSPKALAQLGISTQEYNKELAKTGDMATALGNLMAESMAKSGTGAKTVSGILDKWSVQWDNLKSSIGMLINNLIVKIAPYIDEITDSIKVLWDNTTKWIIDTYNGFADLYNNSVMFRISVEAIGLMFKTVWAGIKLFFSLLIDNFKGTGKLIAYVIDPRNWGSHFSEGLGKVMAFNGKEIVDDFKDFGKSIGGAINDGIASMGSPMKHYQANTNQGTGETTDVKPVKDGDNSKMEKDIQKANEYLKYLESITKAHDSFTRELEKDMNDIGEIDFENINPAHKLEKWEAPLTSFQQFAKHFGTSVSASFDLAPTINAAFENVANGIADALTGGGIQSALQGFLTIITDFMSNFGKQLVALSIGAIAIEHMFKNPYLGVAAGVALIALSKVIKNVTSKGGPKFADGGIVPGYQYSGDRTPIFANAGEMILNSGQQATLFKQLNGGSQKGGGTLTAHISGNDLVFILDQTRHKQGYSY